MTANFRISTIVLAFGVILALLPYDIYEVGLGLVAAIALMRVAEQINSRFGRVLIYVGTAIPAVQLMVLGRKAICEEGLYRTLETQPVSFIAGDIAYGFKHVVLTVYQSGIAMINYCRDEAMLPAIEDLNPRLFVVGWLIIGISILLLMKSDNKPKKQTGRVTSF